MHNPNRGPSPSAGQGHRGPAEGTPPAGRPSRANVELPCDDFTWLKYGEKILVHPRRTR